MSGPPEAASEAVVGSLQLEEHDLRDAITEMWGFPRLIGFSLLTILTFIAMSLWREEPWSERLRLSGIFVVLLSNLWLSPRFAARRLRRAVRAGEKLSYRFDSDSVTLPIGGVMTTIAYRSLAGYSEGTTTLLISSERDVANIVPKRAFTPGELERVRGWLAARQRRSRNIERLFNFLFVAVFLFAVLWLFLMRTAPPRPG